MKTTASILLLLLLLALPVAAQSADGGVTDEDYRFRLAPPGGGWRVFGEKEARRVVPDAVAGGVHDRGFFGAVIVEGAPGVELKPMAELVLENLPIEGKVVDDFSSVTFCGRPAIRFKVHGLINGVEFAYQSILFLNEGHLYQVINWGLRERVRPGSFDPFTGAFSLLPGAVTGRSARQMASDSHGVGWRLKDGAFESAALRIAIRPPEGWRIAIGQELDGMNTDAEVGLCCAAPEIYLVVLPEIAVGVDQDAFIARAVADVGDESIKESGPPRKMQVAGHQVEVRRFTSQGAQSFDFHKCAFFVGDTCIQVLAWYRTGFREQAEKRLPEAFGAIRTLSVEEAGAVQAELLAGPDPENRVGAEYSLRRGVYRNFEYGLSWTKPAGFWRVKVGDEARVENEDATLMLEEPSLGLHGVLIVEDIGELDGPTYHELVVGGMVGEERAAAVAARARKVTLGGVPALQSTETVDFSGIEISCHMTSLVRNGLGIQFLMSGVPANMAAAADQVEAAFKGLTINSRMEAVTRKGDTVRDLRLGFWLRSPGPTWRFLDVTPESIQPMASVCEWKFGKSEFVCLALCALREGGDAAWFEQFLAQAFLQQFKLRLGVDGEPTRGKGRLGDLEATLLRWKGVRGSAEVLWCRRDNTFYAVITTGKATHMTELAGNFGFLE